MIFAGFSLVKLLSGLAFWKGDKLGKLIFQVAIIALCLWVFYAKFIAKDAPVTNQQGAQITNITQAQESNEIQILPPQIKIGNTKIKLLWF